MNFDHLLNPIVTIRGVKTGKYICCNLDGKCFGNKRLEQECYFEEILVHGTVQAYNAEIKCIQNIPTIFLSFLCKCRFYAELRSMLVFKMGSSFDHVA